MRTAILAVICLVSLLVVGALAMQGAAYYARPLEERPHHAGYWSLKPGGSRGHLYGAAGSAMMVLMLSYSLRKRSRRLRRVGPTRYWLDAHIYFGIFGPLLIVLHSSLKVGGLVALSFWSMVAVAASGLVGRFLYVRIPRTRAGDELSLAAVQRLDEELTAVLEQRFGVPPAQLAALSGEISALPGRARGRRRMLRAMLLDGFRTRRRLRGLTATLGHVPAATAREMRDLLLRKAMLARRVALWDDMQRLFHYWHVFHKPFAIVMYLFMIVHVAVALATGYGWGHPR
ncbi:MAG: hypothetical protein HYV63_17475 [Candidatus Schekmanbacteria bacterium]|nr:hypothetical protein [Candidatus Schekmanbacteria bacterium]